MSKKILPNQVGEQFKETRLVLINEFLENHMDRNTSPSIARLPRGWLLNVKALREFAWLKPSEAANLIQEEYERRGWRPKPLLV